MFQYLWIYICIAIYAIWGIFALVDVVRTLIEHVKLSKIWTEKIQKELEQMGHYYPKQTFFEEFRDYLDELETYTWGFLIFTIFALTIASAIVYGLNHLGGAQ